MIVIALSWIILLIFFIPSGIAVKSILNLKSSGNYIPIYFGLFFQCLFLSICSFFIKIGLAIFILNSILILGICVWRFKDIKESLRDINADIKALSIISKLSLVFIFIYSIFKCAQSPFIIDNESYYIQTIKWVNEYGYVRGLGNLHIFLGQTSPFHVLQAGFNFNFLTDRINDLNGLILLISSTYFIIEFEKIQKEKNEIHWIGLIPFLNILFFQFINAPSPDLSIILVCQIVFYYFLEKENTNENFKIISLLFLFVLFIKITIAPFVLLVIYLVFKNRIRLYFFGICISIIGIIFILKNIIITAYPLYPFDIFSLDVDWKIPKNLLEFITTITIKAGYFKSNFIANMSMTEKLNSWIHLGGVNRIFNFGIIFLFVIGLFVKNKNNQTKYKFLYIVLAIHFILLLFTSPQFRFFLPEFVFFFVISSSVLFRYFKINFKTTQYIVLASVMIPVFILEFVDYKDFTSNKMHQQKELHSWNQILLPEKNTKYVDLKYEKIINGNLIYNSPIENFFFYGTANGNLPCVNKVQIKFIEKKYHYTPQMRTSYLGDGFYSKKTDLDD
jgi:hypothetical protein